MVNVPRLEDMLRQYTAQRAELEARGIYYVRDIDDESAEMFSKSLLLMALGREGRPELPITVYISSGGGSVGPGLAMIEAIHRVQHQFHVKVNTVVLGYAYSMASVLVQAGDRRSMGGLSTMMLHSSSWLLSGEDNKIFRDYQKLADHYQYLVSNIFATRTGHKDIGWWRRFVYSGHDRFLTAGECVELGLVDDLLEYPDDPADHEPQNRRTF